MAVLAKPAKKQIVVRVDDKKAFLEKFNSSMPSEKAKESVKKAGKLVKWEK